MCSKNTDYRLIRGPFNRRAQANRQIVALYDHCHGEVAGAVGTGCDCSICRERHRRGVERRYIIFQTDQWFPQHPVPTGCPLPGGLRLPDAAAFAVRLPPRHGPRPTFRHACVYEGTPPPIKRLYIYTYMVLSLMACDAAVT